MKTETLSMQAPFAALFLALCWLVAADAGVEAVHIYAQGSSHHDRMTTGSAPRQTEAPTGPEWTLVVPVNTDNFEAATSREPLSLVFFYAHWSHSSNAFYDELNDIIASELAAERPGIPVFAVNLEESPDLGKQYQINSFPTFAVFRYGHLAPEAENQVPRYAPATVAYVKSLLRTVLEKITSTDRAKALVDPKTLQPVSLALPPFVPVAIPHPDDQYDKAVVFGFFDSDMAAVAYEEVARITGGRFRMAIIVEDHIRKVYKARGDTIVVYRKWGSPVVIDVRGEMLQKLRSDIMGYVVYNAIAPLAIFDEDTKHLYAQRHKPLLVYFSPLRLTQADPRFKILADIGSDDGLNVTVTQANPNTAGRLVARFLGMDDGIGFKGWSLGMVVGRRKYRFDDNAEDITAESLHKFVTNVIAGKWPEYHKSELRSHIHPASAGVVSELAYIDFEKTIVEDTARDAIILFYSLEDASSREFLALFDTLASEMKSIEGLVVARMNVAENDYHDRYVIPGYPSVLYAPRTKKLEPVRMTGVARTVASLKDFISQNAAISLAGFAPSNQTPSAPATKAKPPPREEEL